MNKHLRFFLITFGLAAVLIAFLIFLPKVGRLDDDQWTGFFYQDAARIGVKGTDLFSSTTTVRFNATSSDECLRKGLEFAKQYMKKGDAPGALFCGHRCYHDPVTIGFACDSESNVLYRIDGE